MNAARRKRKGRPIARFGAALHSVLLGSGGRMLTAGAMMVALFAGAIYVWRHWGAEITRQPEYVLRPEGIEISPPPKWIPEAKFKAEVIRDGGLSGLSILDRELTIKVAEAFGRHSWVKTVTRVSKHHPARVVVEMQYRKPVAMVEVVIDGTPGLLPVDVESVLLPPEDFLVPPADFAGSADQFATEQARKYLRIAVPDAVPTGAVGTAWGDRRIIGAARIAAVLEERWKSLGLYRIGLHRERSTNTSSTKPAYDLLTRNGVRVVWGKAPEPNDPSDVRTAADKLAKLVAYVDANGPLESLAPSADIDLRSDDQRRVEAAFSAASSQSVFPQ